LVSGLNSLWQPHNRAKLSKRVGTTKKQRAEEAAAFCFDKERSFQAPKQKKIAALSPY
jgi:hypothetical protein